MSKPNRIVIETHRFDPLIESIRAERPSEVLIIFRSKAGAPDETWGKENGGLLPIEPLGVTDGPGEVRFEVNDAQT